MWPTFLSLCPALSRMPLRQRPPRRPAFRRPLLEGLEERTLPSVFTVTNTIDDGRSGSLRWAINQANATNTGTAGNPDLIEFAIPASDPGHLYYTNLAAQATATTAATDDSTIAGIDPAWPHSWWSIEPASALPAITDSVVIDGYSQPGASANTLAAGDNAVLRIELDGSAFASAQQGASLGLGAGLNINLNTTVQGLVINRFVNGLLLGWGVGSIPTQYDTIQGNFIGTDVSGTVGEGNLLHGINVGSQNNVIGGTAASARNVISGNGYNGVYIISAANNSVLGNLIGTNTAGTAAVANGLVGVGVNTPGGGAGVAVATTAYGVASGNTIGGTSSAAGNVISGNAGWGVFVGGPGNLVQGNLIGTDVNGMFPLGNGGPGVEASGASNTIGGSTIGAGNVISANQDKQVELDTASNTVQGSPLKVSF